MFSKALLTFVALAASARASCMHATSLLPRQEGEVKISDFSYTGETGPLNWAGLSPDNVACRTGTTQSPIVLDDTIPFATEKPKVTIAPVAEAEFENLGTTLETIVEGETEFAGAKFKLLQFHYHTPSEHRINEEYFPLEMHLVHEGENGAIAVIAVPFQLSEDGTTTELVVSTIENIADVQQPGTATKTGPLDFTELIAAIEEGPLFQYTGSLTTPPCAEGLTFLVLEKPLPLDVKTFNTLKSTIKFNARYSQNSLNKLNLLDVAVNLAAKEAGVDINANVGVNGTNNVNIEGEANVDVNELVQQLVAQNKNLKFDTITKTTTTVVVIDENGNVEDINNGEQEQNNNEEENNNDEEEQNNNEQEQEQNNGEEEQNGAGGEEENKTGEEITPLVGSPDVKLVNIARSRIFRSRFAKRRLN